MKKPSAAAPAPLTPATAELMRRIQRSRRPALHHLPADQAKALYESGAEILDLPRVRLARVEDLTLPLAPGHERVARLYAPSHAVLPVLLYLHGGGFTVGGLETHDSLCRQLALRSGVAVLALDYRLAPEHRFPAAVDDSWAALRWLADNAAPLGLDASRIAIGGDSAGGTLAAVAALHARDIGLKLALQVLITPGTTAHADTPSHGIYAKGFLLEREAIDWFFDHYIDHADRSDWRFAPLLADDLDGVAPAWIGLAECDPLVDEGVAYADSLRLAGVPVELELWRGVTHDFIKLGRVIGEAHEAQISIARALQRAFGRHEVQIGTWAELGEAAHAIRHEVFVLEQQIPAELEWDVADAGCVHALARDPQGTPIATGRLLSVAPGVSKIGRMAVRASMRGHGAGQAVLAALVAAARARGDHQVMLHAQQSALGFYLRAGFTPQGEAFEEAGLAHQEMVRAL